MFLEILWPPVSTSSRLVGPYVLSLGLMRVPQGTISLVPGMLFAPGIAGTVPGDSNSFSGIAWSGPDWVGCPLSWLQGSAAGEPGSP